MTNRQAAIQIVKTLRRNGFQALLAGGCVRDMLLHRRPKDHDIVTNATPPQIMKLFKRTLKIGAKFGVVMVLINNQQIEVATFRTDAGYSDGRRPDKIEFSDARTDALRRDFTINGMFYDPIEKKVYDFVGGQRDLQNKIIRTIGNPDTRFSEDYLRMLRAVRFSAQLGFEIEPETFDSIRRNAHLITNISGERITMELQNLFACDERILGLKNFFNSNLAKAVFPILTEVSQNFIINVVSHLPAKCSFPLALASLFADCDTACALKSAEILKLSNQHKKHLQFLLEKRSVLLNSDMPLAQLKLLLACPYFQDLFNFQKALCKAKSEPLTPLNKIKKRAQALEGKELCPKPLLNGHELMALGCKPGPALGILAQELYIAQLSEEITTKQQARQWAIKWLKDRSRTDN